MKKAIILIIILFIPLAAFAEVQFGPTAFYNFPLISNDQFHPPEAGKVNASNFTFGADFRLKLGLLQVGAMGLFTPGVVFPDPTAGTITIPASMDVFLDAGIAIDLLLIRLGIGAGPNLTLFFEDAPTVSDTVSSGVNIKAIVDVLFENLSIGVIYLNQFDFDFDSTVGILSGDKTKGLFGVAALFRF